MGVAPIYAETAYNLGQMLASRGLGLVYGGGKMGLMGRVADGVIEAQGHVTGIISAVAFSFMVQEPSEIIEWFNDRSLPSSLRI